MSPGSPMLAHRPIAVQEASEVLDSFRAVPGLYLHVPFCSSICPFCPYNKVVHRKEVAGRYFEALEREAASYLEAFQGEFTSLYIGGGTPTLCLDELSNLVRSFPVARERAIEVLPNHATTETVARLRKMGITYVSLGIQSFDERMLLHLQRQNTVADNRRALENSLGQFECVDVDLIFDVAFQDQGVFVHDAEICFRAGVDQISTYPLMRFGYTPFGKGKHDARKEHQVLRAVQSLAERYGYERRSVWTFNRKRGPDYSSITREFYLGLGAGAASYTGRQFLVNHFGIEPYVKKLDRGRLPVARRAKLGEVRSAVYYLFWQAYTGSVDLGRLERLFPVTRYLRPLSRLFAWTGHISHRGSEAVLTPKGYDLYHDLERWVTYHFIEPLWGDMMKEHQSGGTPAAQPLGLAGRSWRSLAGVEPF